MVDGQLVLTLLRLYITYALFGMGEGYLEEPRGASNEDTDQKHEHYARIGTGLMVLKFSAIERERIDIIAQNGA